MRAHFERIGAEYRSATSTSFTNHPLANFIRRDAKDAIVEALSDQSAGLLVKGSAGLNDWATVPWLAVFDPIITTGAERGYYVVYLFHASLPIVHLSMNQGVTAVRDEFGKSSAAVLKERAELIRLRIPEFVKHFSVYPLDLGSNKRLPRGYELGHAFGRQYDLRDLPDESTFRNDLQVIVKAYRTLIFRGGLDPSPEPSYGPKDAGKNETADLLEVRRYRYHRKIERNAKASQKAKESHGLQCQACGMNFSDTYGPLGEGYIEAHHLFPLSQLNEGEPVAYNVARDFAVLCSNCHRMAHRLDDPSDVAHLRTLIKKK